MPLKKIVPPTAKGGNKFRCFIVDASMKVRTSNRRCGGRSTCDRSFCAVHRAKSTYCKETNEEKWEMNFEEVKEDEKEENDDEVEEEDEGTQLLEVKELFHDSVCSSEAFGKMEKGKSFSLMVVGCCSADGGDRNDELRVGVSIMQERFYAIAPT
ncbi:hypothetical protein HZH68_010328 [Vespula germanica]|uniref:Uncharacterized protein n=1 Tax=Vespula germanica TaxID=30212 RepID=A0A834JV27_VESGE|nr:hypothetical protein HZH68_010328 [Vespula germanica]